MAPSDDELARLIPGIYVLMPAPSGPGRVTVPGDAPGAGLVQGTEVGGRPDALRVLRQRVSAVR